MDSSGPDHRVVTGSIQSIQHNFNCKIQNFREKMENFGELRKIIAEIKRSDKN